MTLFYECKECPAVKVIGLFYSLYLCLDLICFFLWFLFVNCCMGIPSKVFLFLI